MQTLSCFKAYDIRGQLGSELNEQIAYRIGRAYGEYLKPKKVVVGGDVRLSSPSLKQALANGLMDAGADVLDLGMTGTEEVYFASFHLDVDGGIEVTASHNPIDYNGMKLVAAGARPISGDTGLREIQRLAEQNQFAEVRPEQRGRFEQGSVLSAYIEHLLSYIDCSHLQPMRLVVNAGNGAAGHVIDALDLQFQKLGVPIQFIRLHHEADGSFPHGIPNPLLPECRADTAQAVIAEQADMGIAWDGDFDRCFLFDETGQFIEGYYIVGLLAQAFLKTHPNAKIIHDPRLTWNTVEMVQAEGGIPVQSKTGHAFIKERMRQEDAVYGGEMSAHHYFRDFAYCDSGMIPWLLVIELLSKTGQKLSALVNQRIARFPSSGEINRKVVDAKAVLERVQQQYLALANKTEFVDGLSMEFDHWRFNLRSSNTEPVIRLNVETRENQALMQLRTNELLSLIY